MWEDIRAAPSEVLNALAACMLGSDRGGLSCGGTQTDRINSQMVLKELAKGCTQVVGLGGSTVSWTSLEAYRTNERDARF